MNFRKQLKLKDGRRNKKGRTPILRITYHAEKKQGKEDITGENGDCLGVLSPPWGGG